MAATPVPTICGFWHARVFDAKSGRYRIQSPRNPARKLRPSCKSQDQYVIYRVYEDAGFSADTHESTGSEGKCSGYSALDGYLACWRYKIDRLTRSVKDFHVLMDLFGPPRRKFVSITQSLDTHHPMDDCSETSSLDFAQSEREMTADRTRDKMQQRATKGLWNGGIVPFGYRNEDKVSAWSGIPRKPRVQSYISAVCSKTITDLDWPNSIAEGWLSRRSGKQSKMTLASYPGESRMCGHSQFNDQPFEGSRSVDREGPYHRFNRSSRPYGDGHQDPTDVSPQRDCSDAVCAVVLQPSLHAEAP